MTSWIELIASSGLTSDLRPVVPGDTLAKATLAASRVEKRLLDEYNGTAWLAREGYERVLVSLEFVLASPSKKLRSVKSKGRLLMVDFTCVIPELSTAKVKEIEVLLEAIIPDILELVGGDRKLGPPLKNGDVEPEVRTALRPLIADDMPAADELGEIFVITRELPEQLSTEQLSGVFERYEDELERLLSDEAWGNVIETETSATAIRWVVRIIPKDPPA
jgi:hypothetical protein